LNTYFIYSAKVLATTDCMAGQTWSWTGLIWNCAQKISFEYPIGVLKHPDKTGNIFLSEVICYNLSFGRQIRPVCISVSQKLK